MGGRGLRHGMRALMKECKKTEYFSIVTPIISPPIEYENAKEMIKRVENWLQTEGLDPHMKSFGEGRSIINFQGLNCGMDSTTNVSDPNAIRLARHLIIRRNRMLMGLEHDHRDMWADFFLHKSLSTGHKETKTISVATVARTIQIMGMDEITRQGILLPRTQT